MKKILSMLLVLALLVPTFSALPAFAADDEPAQSDKDGAEIYDKDGKLYSSSLTLDGAVSLAEQFGGTVKLLADRIDYKPLEIGKNGDVTIDLNGRKIKSDLSLVDSDKDGSVIRLGKGAHLTITDSSKEKSGIIEGGCAKWGGGIYAPENNVVTMNAGTITNCYAYYGGGVYVEDKATLETNGGEISDCVASKDGGGIYICSAYANLNRCYIANNHADDGGAIYSDYNSYITISGSTIASNTADDCYGGIYHCDGRLTLQNGTMVSDNKSNGKYGGGVFSDSSIELGGAVYIYGNRSKVIEPCDVSFGKDLNSAFKIIYKLSDQSLIGVNINDHKPKTWYNGDHVSYGDCQEEDKEKANSLATALFSNNDYTSGFSYTFDEKGGELYEHLHYVRVVSGGNSDNEKINVTKVSYRNVPLSQSDYTAEYSSTTHTIVLNVPDYVKNQEYLTVETDKYNINFWAGNKVATGGWSEDYKTRCGLIVRNDNESESYTVSVEGGTVDGKELAQKKYFDDLNIEPTVPNGMIFSHWEVDGDYTISSIIGFNQYTKIPMNMLMPNGNVKFKAVFRTKVTDVDVYMTTPTVGSPTPFYGKNGKDETKCPWIKAAVVYKTSSGDEFKKDKIDITWNKEQEMFDGTAIHYFDYFAKYLANFQIEDTPGGDFGLADDKELTVNLYVNNELVESNLKTYITNYEYVYGDDYNYRWSNDNNPVKQRILHATYYYRSEKAPVKKAVPAQISVQSGTTKEELIKLLPESVNVEIADINYTNGKEQSETTHSPVVWNKDNLPATVTESFTIQGTLNTENEGFEVKNGDNIQPTLIVDPITQGKSQMPQVTVDGTPVTVIDGTAKIALGKKIKFATSMVGATIHYTLDGKQYECAPDDEIEISGKEKEIITYKLEAYAQNGEEKSETLELTIEVDNKTTYTVNILDTDGIEYKYANGGGEYKLGDKVSVDLTRAYMVNEGIPGSTEKEWVPDPRKIATAWSAKGILLNDEQMAKPVFNFEMPNSNVIIKIEKFGNREQVHTVTIVDKDDKTYEYALGAGEYKAGETVTIDSTQFMLKSVDADGIVTSEKTNVPEKVVSQWSAKGITLSEDQIKADKFEFEMPYNDVTIKAENFRFLVKKLYLSSLTPIAGQTLPDKLEIISARDINGKLIDKDDILLKTELYADSGGSWATTEGSIPAGTKAESGKTYITMFSVQPVSGEMAALDDYEIYMDDKKVETNPLFGPYVIPVEVEAVNDELLSVDLPDSMLFYSMSDAIDGLPQKVNIRTKYGTKSTAEVKWSGTDKMHSYLAFGSFDLTAELELPDCVVDKNDFSKKKVTAIVCQHIDAVKLTLEKGNIPTKAGEKLPQDNEIDVRAVEHYVDYPSLKGFEVLNKNNENVAGETAQAGEQYTIKAKIGSNVTYTVLSENTVFMLDGKTMNVVDASSNEDPLKGNIYEVSYTFTAEDVKSYKVMVNNGSIGTYKNGDTVNINADDTAGFYNWTAEAVYTTDDGVEHRKPVNLFDDDKEYEPSTSFVMPQLMDDSCKLEITANYSYGIASYNKDTKTVSIVTDNACSGVKVIFATYDKFDELISVKLADVNLAKGENSVEAPADFVVNDGEKVRIMVWDNLDDMTPLFEALEQTYEKKNEETTDDGNTEAESEK